MTRASLFERLGGSPGIKAIVEDIVALHMENPVICSGFSPIGKRPTRKKW